jgi:hypothetical protein
MRSIFGIYPSEVFKGCGPLEQKNRVIFDQWKGQVGCYFELIAPYFEELVRKQSEIDIAALNVLLVLGGNDLDSAVAICDAMLSDFAKRDEQWRLHHGWVKSPGREEREIVVTLYRKRLLAAVRWMSTQFDDARRNRHCLVFGNGVFFRMLAGVPNDGVPVYS